MICLMLFSLYVCFIFWEAIVFIHCNTPLHRFHSISATSLQFVLHIIHLIIVLRFDVL